MRYAITIEYLGSAYAGWQSQINALAVQDVVNEKLSELFCAPIKTEGSGRTDSGVHAMGQVAHFDADKKISAEKLPMAINTLLPDDIRVTKAQIVTEDFHARFSAKQKTYIYKTYISRISSPVRRATYVQIVPPIDVQKIKDAAQNLVGTHDFKAFSSVGSTVASTVRTLYKVEVREEEDELIFTLTGDGFLYNMVRIIVGTLVYIGKGKLPVSVIDEMLATGNRKLGGKTFPSNGLCLAEVKY